MAYRLAITAINHIKTINARVPGHACRNDGNVDVKTSLGTVLKCGNYLKTTPHQSRDSPAAAPDRTIHHQGLADAGVPRRLSENRLPYCGDSKLV